jgi:hypothetical protein
MIITTTYRFIGTFVKGHDSLRVEFAPPMMERYSQGPLGVTSSIIVWPNTGDNVTGMPEHVNEKKEYKTCNEEIDIVSMCMTQEDTNISHLRFCKVSQSKGSIT